jgi:hypothetical protein
MDISEIFNIPNISPLPNPDTLTPCSMCLSCYYCHCISFKREIILYDYEKRYIEKIKICGQLEVDRFLSQGENYDFLS